MSRPKTPLDIYYIVDGNTEAGPQKKTSAKDILIRGAKDALILLRETALVVSVKNRTVITAVDEASAKENIFTNIDSAAIL